MSIRKTYICNLCGGDFNQKDCEDGRMFNLRFKTDFPDAGGRIETLTEDATGNAICIKNIRLKVVSDTSVRISAIHEKRLTLMGALRFLDTAAGRKLLKGRGK